MAGRGRPRSFDRTEALRQAMTVFWEHGFEGASIADLTRAMGINSPSLYAAFGSKERLFLEAVEYYDLTEGADATRALREQPTARAAFAEMLRANVIGFTRPDAPHGCMIVLSATTYTDNSATVRDHVRDLRLATQQAFADRVERGIADGDVPPDADPAAVAAFYNAVLEGLAVQARDGVARDTLSTVVTSAIAAWDLVTGTPPDRARTPATVTD